MQEKLEKNIFVSWHDFQACNLNSILCVLMFAKNTNSINKNETLSTFTFLCLGTDYTCRVRAATKISKGCEITTTYTLTLNGTMYRRKHLLDSKYFLCTCRRCSDPTELGTHFSTVLCQQCKKGYVTVVDPFKDAVCNDE